MGVPERDRHGLTGQRRAAERLGPHVFLRYVRERSALFFGLADSTMSHDDAWRFLVLGRSLERVDMTARLLLARMPGPAEESWPLLLHACGAYESFIRTHGWPATRPGWPSSCSWTGCSPGRSSTPW